MRRVSVFQWALLGAVTALAPAGWSADCSEPVTLPEKPRLSQFANYNTFLVEMLEFKSAKRKQVQHRKACPQAYTKPERPSRNPTEIREPETLSEALQRAEKIPRLDYSEHQTWYNRTTSRSFPLPDLGRDRLSDNMLESNLRMMRSDASPRSGADWLPGIFNTSLNMARFSGKETQYRDWLFFAEWLPEQERRAQRAEQSENLANRISYTAVNAPTPRSSVTLFIDSQGETIGGRTVSNVESCLSSCVSNP